MPRPCWCATAGSPPWGAGRRWRTRRGIDVRRVDLAGRTLLPAFLDAHSHFTAVANQFLQVSLEGCTSWADMQDRIRDYIRRERIPAGQWVTAQGYDHNLLSERRHPDRLCLDAAAPDNPVVICHQSGHMGVFNTAALERLGVTAQTPAPPEASSDGRTAPSPATWRKTPFWSSRSGCP